MKEEDVAEHIKEVNDVAVEYLKGKTVAVISTELKLPKHKVASYISEWKNMAANSEAVRARSREALAGADLHYTDLIREAHEIAVVASNANNLAAQTAALKLVLDIEKSRLDMLQKAGLLENRELAEKVVETERVQAAIMKVLTEVSGNCPHCKPKILSRLAGLGESPVVM